MTIKDSTVKSDVSASVIIAAAGDTSLEVDIYGTTLVGLELPATFEGTSLSILASRTAGGTYKTVYIGGADLAIAVAANKFVKFDNLHTLVGLRFIKLKSNNTVAADRTINLISYQL